MNASPPGWSTAPVTSGGVLWFVSDVFFPFKAADKGDFNLIIYYIKILVEQCCSYTTSTIDGSQSFRTDLIMVNVCNQKHCLQSEVCIEILQRAWTECSRSILIHKAWFSHCLPAQRIPCNLDIHSTFFFPFSPSLGFSLILSLNHLLSSGTRIPFPFQEGNSQIVKQWI